MIIKILQGRVFEGIDTASVHFSESMPDEFIEQLIMQGDVMSCSGGFTIEHMDEYIK